MNIRASEILLLNEILGVKLSYNVSNLIKYGIENIFLSLAALILNKAFPFNDSSKIYLMIKKVGGIYIDDFHLVDKWLV